MSLLHIKKISRLHIKKVKELQHTKTIHMNLLENERIEMKLPDLLSSQDPLVVFQAAPILTFI